MIYIIISKNLEQSIKPVANKNTINLFDELSSYSLDIKYIAHMPNNMRYVFAKKLANLLKKNKLGPNENQKIIDKI